VTEKKVGYIFETKLIEAIDEYVTIKKNLSPKYFYYKDIDFFSAFKRECYYGMMSEGYYLNQLNSTHSEVIECRNSIQKDILKLMYMDKKYFIRKNLKENLKYKLKSFPILFPLYQKIKNKKYLNISNIKVVFIITQVKFIHYLEAIYERTENSVFMIFGDIEKSISYCEKKRYKYIVYKPTFIKEKKLNLEILALVELYKSIEQYMTNHVFKTFVLPEGDAPLLEIINLYSIENNKKTVCIQHGWNPLYHNGFRDMHYDKFLSWGKEFSEGLSQYNKAQNFIEVGSHILKSSDISIKSNDTISFFLQAIVPLISEKDFNDFLLLISEISYSFPNKNIIVREHPSHPLSDKQIRFLLKNKNLKFMNLNKFSLSEVMQKSSITVSIFSTTLIESLYFDAVPFIINTTGMKHYEPDLQGLGVGIEVDNFEDAYKKLAYLINHSSSCNKIKDNINKYKKSYFKASGDEAINNILKEIL